MIYDHRHDVREESTAPRWISFFFCEVGGVEDVVEVVGGGAGGWCNVQYAMR